MNFSAPTLNDNTAIEQIESLHDWWSLSGVDLHYKHDPSSLLEVENSAGSVPETPPTETIAPTEIKPPPTDEKPQPRTQNEAFPNQYEDFISWLSRPENLIEAPWSQNQVLPWGMVEPDIMIIVAMPEQDRSAQNSLFSDKSTALLTNMLKAIGCDSEKTYFASLSLGRSFDGRIEPRYHEPLKKRILHHIGLVRPKKIIVLGETPSLLFFDQNLLTARKNKQFVNHISSKTEAIATFHPRILIERPEFKAEAWKDLQLLTRNPST